MDRGRSEGDRVAQPIRRLSLDDVIRSKSYWEVQVFYIDQKIIWQE